MTQSLETQKTLLLVGSKPGSGTVGEILIREMLSCLDPNRYVIAALLRSDNRDVSGDTSQHHMKTFQRPREAEGVTTGKFARLKNATKRILGYERDISSLSKKVESFAREQGVKRVWSILNMTSVIDVTARLMPKLNIPLLAHVWDDVDHLTQQRNLDSLTRGRTRKRFARLLSRAERTAVICEAMQQEYETQYQAKCQIIRHGISDHVVPLTSPTSNEEFRIGFSGGMYANSAWKTLLDALSLMNWKVQNKRITFVVMSGSVSFSANTPMNVHFLGWQETDEVAKQLANCDLLYLPQPFEAHQRPIAQLSFPTKLSAYANTGRPVLVHAPSYGSLSTFYQQHPIGGLCQELNAGKLADTIQSIAEDQSAYEKAAYTVSHVAENVLSRSRFEHQVRSFLNEPATDNLEVTPRVTVVQTQEHA